MKLFSIKLKYLDLYFSNVKSTKSLKKKRRFMSDNNNHNLIGMTNFRVWTCVDNRQL